MKNMINKTRGITLIALVITIIVLLILAGITIASLTGENGLLQRAVTAKDETEKAGISDELQLAVLDSITEKNGKYNAADVASKINALQGASATASGNTITGTYKGYSFTVDENGKVTIENKSNPPAGGTALKVGDTDLSTVTDISTMYGQTTDYKSTSHPNIDWQLFYSDSNNYYVIASDYVPNAELPCNGNTGFGATDLIKSTSTTNQWATYCAKFCSDSNYNDGVLTTGTIYKNGSSSTAIANNALSSTYLKWATTYNTSTNNNISSVAYMMDTIKWSSFADGAGNDAFAIGGPTIDMLSKSWNAVSGHAQMTDYTTLSSSNSNSTGYIPSIAENGSNFYGTATNM